MASHSQIGELAELRRENTALRAQLATRPTSGPATPSEGRATEQALQLEELKTLRDWVAARRVHLAVQLLGPEGKLSAEFVELFHLTPSDRSLLQNAVDTARRELTALSVSRASVALNPDGSYAIRVPSFIEEGRGTYHRLTEAFERTLGREKSLLFSELMGDAMEPAFNMFGAQERTLTFTRTVGSDGKTSLFRLQDQRLQGVSSQTNESIALTFSQLKTYADLGAFLDLLPPEADN